MCFWQNGDAGKSRSPKKYFRDKNFGAERYEVLYLEVNKNGITL